MGKIALYILAAYTALTGVYIVAAPMAFYTNTPGVSMMGPFNVHFIRDAGLAYIAAGAALAWGNAKGNRSVAITAALWPCLHAVYHIQMWIARGVPADQVALVNLVAIQIPAWASLILAMKIAKAD